MDDPYLEQFDVDKIHDLINLFRYWISNFEPRILYFESRMSLFGIRKKMIFQHVSVNLNLFSIFFNLPMTFSDLLDLAEGTLRLKRKKMAAKWLYVLSRWYNESKGIFMCHIYADFQLDTILLSMNICQKVLLYLSV